MADKKNIVIKIKRPSLRPDHEIQGVTVTQWHFSRIVMAVILLLVVLAGLLCLVLHGLGDAGRQSAQTHNPREMQEGKSAAEPFGQGYGGQPSIKGDDRIRRTLFRNIGITH